MNDEQITNIGFVIFESLLQTKTGLELHSTTIKYNLFDKPFFNLYFDIEDKTSFLISLNEILKQAKEQYVFFFLHFEMHGYEGGVQLKNKEYVSWNEILPILREINIIYRNKLGISMAVCHGASLLKSIDVLDRSPFRFIVSSHRKLNEYDLTIGFEQFFSYLVKDFRVIEAVYKYNQTINDSSNELYIITSEFCLNALLQLESDEKQNINDLFTSHFNSDKKNDKLTNNVINNLKKEAMLIFKEMEIDPNYFLMKDL
jgi:hypothetical protein